MKPVSKELSVWAKEKGFKERTCKWYHESIEDLQYSTELINWNRLNNGLTKFNRGIAAPTHEELKHFIFDKYGIWIEVKENPVKPKSLFYAWSNIINLKTKGFTTPIKALKSALHHIKENNLIS